MQMSCRPQSAWGVMVVISVLSTSCQKHEGQPPNAQKITVSDDSELGSDITVDRVDNLGSPDIITRLAAVDSLAAQGTNCLTLVTQLLDDKATDDLKLQSCCEVAGKLGPSASELTRKLESLLNAKSENVRSSAQWALRQVATVRAARASDEEIDALIGELAYPPEGTNAVKTLVDLGKPATPHVSDLLIIGAFDQRAYPPSLRALPIVGATGRQSREYSTALGWMLRNPKLQYGSHSGRAEVIETIARLSRHDELQDNLVPLLIEALRYHEINMNVPAVEALVTIGQPSVNPIAEAIENEMSRDRLSFRLIKPATEILARIGPDAKSALPQLIRVLEHPTLYDYAAVAICAIDPVDGITAVEPVLLRHLRDAEQGASDAAQVLSHVCRGTPALASALLRAAFANPEDTQSTRALVRAGGVVLGALRSVSGDSIRHLRAKLSDDDPWIRGRAAILLSACGEKARPAVPELTAMLRTDCKEDANWESLWYDKFYPNGGYAFPPKGPSPFGYHQDQAMLRHISPIRAKYDIQLWTYKPPNLRRLVAESLGRLGSFAQPELISILRSTEDEVTRQFVLHAFENFERLDDTLLTVLRKYLDDPTHELQVANILSQEKNEELRQDVLGTLRVALVDPRKALGAAVIISRDFPEHSHEAVEPLLISLASNEVDASEHAAAKKVLDQLVQVGDVELLAVLFRTLSDLSRASAHETAGRLLVKVGEASVPRLVEGVVSNEMDRQLTLWCLAQFEVPAEHWPQLISTAVEVLQSTDESEKRLVRAMFRQSGREARAYIGALLPLLTDERTALNAAICIGYSDPTNEVSVGVLAAMWRSVDKHKRLRAVATAQSLKGRAAKRAYESAVAILHDHTAEVEIRASAALVMVSLNTDSGIAYVMPLLSKLESAASAPQIHSTILDHADEVRKETWEAVVPSFKNLIEADDEELRRFACTLLLSIEPRITEAEDSLAKWLAEDPEDYFVARQVRYALIKSAADPNIWYERWLQTAEDVDTEAGWVLAEAGPGIVPMLCELFQDIELSDERRDLYGDLLGRYRGGATLSVPVLCSVAKRTDDPLRWRAIHSLGRLGPSAKGATDLLITLLSEKGDRLQKQLAAAALGRIGEGAVKAIPSLAATVRADDLDLQWRAIHSLGQIGSASETALTQLIHCLNDPNLRYWYLAAIAKIETRDASLDEAVKLHLSDSDPAIRRLARQILTKETANGLQ
ncbi:HEAT repeat domain-containing protein [Aureliella helgolandensis]|uniref:HEAT repeat protein n=1 Tax=Aureliella helgolandensis TaxID=2527968 RepID=A0A518G9L1_9BACT|nr:HEAT repeat domain-containing protein [Aureliella helgolandensis]QDV25288.1 hypothetical protein Q31a_36120 [Aureliella helgolandensis]